MKVLLCLMVLLPIVLGARLEERFLFGQNSIDSLLHKAHLPSLSDLAHQLVSFAGSDEIEHACESTACPALIGTIPYLHSVIAAFEGTACGYICKQAQGLIQNGK